jgi:hypothetical protein
MCRRVACSTCGRPTFAGCGAHVEQVLADVPRAERCRFREEKAKARHSEEPGTPRSWLRKLLG